jgi:hypothetical protein
VLPFTPIVLHSAHNIGVPADSRAALTASTISAATRRLSQTAPKLPGRSAPEPRERYLPLGSGLQLHPRESAGVQSARSGGRQPGRVHNRTSSSSA